MKILKIKNANNKIVLKNTLYAFIIKGLSLLISFFTIPAFVKYFDNNTYLGIWYTLLSVIIWFLTFDLGIANGVRNELVIALTKNDRLQAKRIISSGFAINIGISIIITLILLSCIQMLDLQCFFNIDNNIITEDTLVISTSLVVVAIMTRFALTFISSIFYALQRSSVNNLISLVVSILQLLYVLCFHYKDPNEAMINISLAYILISNVPIIFAGIYVFCTNLKDCKPEYKYIRNDIIKSILSIGSIFFICQILYMLIVNTNEYLITKFYGADYTVDYTFYYKLTSIISMLVMLALTPIWSIVTKAMEEKDYKWLLSLYKKIKIFGILLFLLQLLIIPFLQIIMDLWLGVNSIKVNYLTALAFALFGGWFTYSSMLSTIVCGLAQMKLQSICYGLGVIIKFGIIIYLSQYWSDWTLVIWVNALVLCIYSIAQQISLDKYFENKIKTI